ncbi:unnamed protein product [Closterium sp. Naga37s-1]|nr:unnamed protein product [Closterium sp. Naga37s-1]
MNDKDGIYEDPESTKVDESEDTDDTGASVEAAVKQEEEIVTMEAAAVNDGDGDGVNTFAAAVVVKDEAVNAKCVGVAVNGDIMVKGSKANATAKGRVLTKEEHVEGYETREVLGVEMPRRSESLKKTSQGLDIKALNFKTQQPSASAAATAAIPLPKSLSSYSNVALLDPRFELYWTINDSDATIRMAARAKTAGWLAIGLSEIGSMVGSDAFVAWVEERDRRVYGTDRFIFDTSGPVLDGKQDWHVLGGSQTTNQSTGDMWTTVHAWRLLDTNDCNDRPIVSGKLHNVIWATGPTDDVSYHGSTRGGGTLVLAPAPPGPSILDPQEPPSTAATASDSFRGMGRVDGQQQGAVGGKEVSSSEAREEEARMLNFTVTGYHVPTDYTSYRCKVEDMHLESKRHAVEWGPVVVDVPLESKRHAVEWGPVINTTHVSSLHHSFLYGCSPEEYPDLPPTGRVFDCMGRPPCSTFVAVWAWGGRPFTLPPNIGYPIGPGYFTKFVLEMHYTNPDGWADIVDSSGVYLKLAPSIPEAPQLKDAHIMKVGLVDHSRLIRVPPGMPSWTHANSCPGECTAAVFKNESVKIIGSILHQHNIGRQPLPSPSPPSLSFLCGSDAASQQTLPVLPEFELLPGDEIRTTCVWDSTSRSEVTVGGLSAEDEMCVAYLVYYSAQHQGQEMHACYTVCGAMDNGTLSTRPTNPNLSTHYICGTGRNQDQGIAISLSTCHHLCTTQTQRSLPLIPLVPSPSPDPPITPPHNPRTKASLSAFPLATISAPLQPAQPAAPQLTLPQPAAPQSGPLQSAAAASLHPSAAASPATPIVVVSPADTTVKAAPAAAAASAAKSALAAMLTALLCSVLALFS